MFPDMSVIKEYKQNIEKMIASAVTPKDKRKVARMARDIWMPELFKVIEVLEKKLEG